MFDDADALGTILGFIAGVIVIETVAKLTTGSALLIDSLLFLLQHH
ncbi:MAG: hypothetical protein IKG01_14770 [Lachnospiraceae bacterium]|nr:hypothetical protein [Lachnospiraceae bacterium]